MAVPFIPFAAQLAMLLSLNILSYFKENGSILYKHIKLPLFAKISLVTIIVIATDKYTVRKQTNIHYIIGGNADEEKNNKIAVRKCLKDLRTEMLKN